MSNALLPVVRELTSERRACLDLWEEIQLTPKKDLDATRPIYEDAGRKNRALKNLYCRLLRLRGVSVSPTLSPGDLPGQDDRAFLALLRYHEDLGFLFSVSFEAGRTLEAIFAQLASQPLALANLKLFSSFSGTHLEESLCNLHGALSSLADSPKDFFRRLDRIVEEIEEKALSHWRRKSSAEKALLTILLRYWLAAMPPVSKETTDKPIVCPITESIGLRPLRNGVDVEIRLALSGFRDASTALTVESETGTLAPVKDGPWTLEVLTDEKWRIRCPSEELASQVDRVTFRITLDSCEPHSQDSVALRIRRGRCCKSCTVEVGDTSGPWGEVQPEKWRDNWLDRIRESTGAVVLAVAGASIGPVDLWPKVLKSQLQKVGGKINDERMSTLRQAGSGRPGEVRMLVFTDADHADAMRNLINIEAPEVEVWAAYLAGYLRDVFPGLALEREGLELLDEYLKPVTEPTVLLSALRTLRRVCEESRQLTEISVNKVYDRSESLRTHIEERLQHLSSTEKVVLRLLHSASKRATTQDIGVDQILEQRPGPSDVSFPDVSKALSRLWARFGLLDRTGHEVPRYRFANRIYANLIEETL